MLYDEVYAVSYDENSYGVSSFDIKIGPFMDKNGIYAHISNRRGPYISLRGTSGEPYFLVPLAAPSSPCNSVLPFLVGR